MSDITSNLVGYWNLDDGSGTTAVDSGSGASNGTLQGGTLPTWITGKIGPYALNIPVSSGTMVSIPVVASQSITTDLTVSAWIRASGTHNNQWAFSKWGTNGHYLLGYSHLNNNKIIGVIRNSACDGNRFAESASTYTDGSWHMITMTWAPGTNVILYIDGNVEIVTGTGSDVATICSTSNTTDTPAIGNYSAAVGGGGYLNGDVDDVRLYARALTAADVLTLYAYPPSSVTNSNFLGFF